MLGQREEMGSASQVEEWRSKGMWTGWGWETGQEGPRGTRSHRFGELPGQGETQAGSGEGWEEPAAE